MNADLIEHAIRKDEYITLEDSEACVIWNGNAYPFHVFFKSILKYW